MSKTASHVKARYNVKTYDKYTLQLRKDDRLNDILQQRKETQPVSEIVKEALTAYFQTEPHNTKKSSKAVPNYKTKRQRRAAIKRIMKQIEQIKAAEEASHDNTPDNLQSAPAYEAAEECISALDEVLETLGEAY